MKISLDFNSIKNLCLHCRYVIKTENLENLYLATFQSSNEVHVIKSTTTQNGENRVVERRKLEDREIFLIKILKDSL